MIRGTINLAIYLSNLPTYIKNKVHIFRVSILIFDSMTYFKGLNKYVYNLYNLTNEINGENQTYGHHNF